MVDYPLFTFLNFFFFSFHIFNVLSFKDNNCWWGQNNRPRQTEGCAMHWYLTLKAGQTQFDGMLTFPVKTSLNNYKLWDGWAMVLILFIKQWVTKNLQKMKIEAKPICLCSTDVSCAGWWWWVRNLSHRHLKPETFWGPSLDFEEINHWHGCFFFYLQGCVQGVRCQTDISVLRRV